MLWPGALLIKIAAKDDGMAYRSIKLHISTWIFCFMATLHVWRQTHFVPSTPFLHHLPTIASCFPMSFSGKLQTMKMSWLLTPLFYTAHLIHVRAVLHWPLKCFWNQGIWDRVLKPDVSVLPDFLRGMKLWERSWKPWKSLLSNQQEEKNKLNFQEVSMLETFLFNLLE